MKRFDASLACLWLGLFLMLFGAFNAVRGEGSVTPLVIIGLCNIAIGAAGRRSAHG